MVNVPAFATGQSYADLPLPQRRALETTGHAKLSHIGYTLYEQNCSMRSRFTGARGDPARAGQTRAATGSIVKSARILPRLRRRAISKSIVSPIPPRCREALDANGPGNEGGMRRTRRCGP